MSTTPENWTELRNQDDNYMTVLDNITEFFRFEKRHENAFGFDDAYYARVADVWKKRIDHELKHLRNPYLK